MKQSVGAREQYLIKLNEVNDSIIIFCLLRFYNVVIGKYLFNSNVIPYEINLSN